MTPVVTAGSYLLSDWLQEVIELREDFLQDARHPQRALQQGVVRVHLLCRQDPECLGPRATPHRLQCVGAADDEFLTMVRAAANAGSAFGSVTLGEFTRRGPAEQARVLVCWASHYRFGRNAWDARVSDALADERAVGEWTRMAPPPFGAFTSLVAPSTLAPEEQSRAALVYRAIAKGRAC